MIFTEKKITITNNQCKIDSPVVLYRGDYNVEVRFTIVSSPYKYSNKQETNIIESTEASYGQLVIQTPDTTPIFSEVTTTKKGAITFTITAEMIDEITEVGNYTFQIRLLDENKESRATIPEVKNGIEIREPIATEDVSTTNEVGVATVGYAVTTAGTTEDAFDSQGNYNKTTWGTGDRITAAKLNKIEAGIDGVNKKAASGDTGGNVDLSNYVTKGVGNASQITFADGQTFQAKLDAGMLKGDKGDPGVNNINDTTASATTTYSSNKIESIKENLSSQIRDIMDNGAGITFEYITEEVEGISCTDITLNVTTLTFTSSGTQTIIATLTPSDTTDTLIYSSNNKNVATVTNNGVVTAIGNGNCTITVTCGSVVKTVNVSVSGITEVVPVTGITVSPTTATINVNDTVTLTPTIQPSNASNQNITWSSDNPTVAQVIDGVVTGKAQGTASIGVATEDGGYSATCNVTVNAVQIGYANLFDKDTMVTTERKGINGHGTIGAYDWGLATVPVQANTQYSLKMCETNAKDEVGYYNGANAGAIGFADSTGTTLLSYISLGNPSNTAGGVNADLREYAHGEVTGYGSNEKGVEWVTFTTPADCCYLLFNTKLKNNADKIQLEKGDTIHDYYLAYNGGGN